MSAKIEDVDSSLQREVKRTRGDVEKITKDIKSVHTKIEESENFYISFQALQCKLLFHLFPGWQ